MTYVHAIRKDLLCVVGDQALIWSWLNREYASYAVKSWHFTNRDKLFYDLDEIDNSDTEICVIEFDQLPPQQILKDIDAYKKDRYLEWHLFNASRNLQDYMRIREDCFIHGS